MIIFLKCQFLLNVATKMKLIRDEFAEYKFLAFTESVGFEKKNMSRC